MKSLRIRRRRGQGMTEYILLVGLIAILLVAVVSRFREQIDVTIRGSGNRFEDEYKKGGGFPPPNNPPPNPGLTPTGPLPARAG